MKRILCIDGGGIRGIIPAMVLAVLEEKLQRATHNPDARLVDYFDFVAGTSTGGILGCALLCPDKETGRPRYSAKDVVQLYLSNGEKIFDTNFFKKFIAQAGLLDEKYPAEGIESVLKSYFKDLKLSELLKPCLITSYNIEQRKTHFFGQHKALKDGPNKDFLVREVCRATSAAPSYFEPALIRSLGDIRFPLIDGGIFANNPTLCTYAEVRKSKGKSKKSGPTAKDMFIVSLGTGSVKRPYFYEKMKDQLALFMIPALIDMMMSGVAETIDFQMQKMFDAIGRPEQYIRVDAKSLPFENSDMDNAAQDNMEQLKAIGERTATECENELERIVKILLDPKNAAEKVEFV